MSSSTSSAWHPHPLCWSSRSQMFFKIGVPKNFTNVTGKHLCFPVKFAKLLRTPFFHRTPPVVAFIYVAFHECFFFYFSLAAAISLLPYSTITFFIWRNTFVFISLLHHYYHNTRRFIRIAATATTYCTANSMIVIHHINALMEFMLKWKKITYEQSITEEYSFIKACNFTNLLRMYDFSKFCSKPDKADADILKKYIQSDLKSDLVTAS